MLWAIDHGHVRHTIEVEPRVQLAGPAHPTCAKRDIVGSAIDRGTQQRGLNLIRHVTGAPGGDEAQNLVTGCFGIIDNLAVSGEISGCIFF